MPHDGPDDYAPRPDLPCLLSAWPDKVRAGPRAFPDPAPERTLQTVQDAGLEAQAWLMQKKWTAAGEWAAWLAEVAELDAANPADVDRWAAHHSPNVPGNLVRIAAAFHAWPYYAAVYYRPEVGGDGKARVAARQRLCAIQRILYAHSRWTLDYLREAFHLLSHEGLQSVLLGARRREWRPEALVDHHPDLCAVDALGAELARVVRSLPRLRRALNRIHGAIVSGSFESLTEGESLAQTGDVLRSFHDLGVAQLTVFYAPNPQRADREDFPLQELVHRAEDNLKQVLDNLIPFHRRNGNDGWEPDEPNREAFRRLVNTIFSDQTGRRNGFAQHRKFTKSKLDATKIVAGGEITAQFIENYPAGRGWPGWFAVTLADLPPDEKDVCDWEDEWWWQSAEPEVVLKGLLNHTTDDATPIHANHHASAFWDAMVARQGRTPEAAPAFPDSWGVLEQFVTNRGLPNHPCESPTEQIGPFPEVLLRQEPEVRTSFFFGVGQNYTSDGATVPSAGGWTAKVEGKITQFVGGTFLGLERPGIPFEEYRFTRLADHMRSLVLGLAHFCTSRALREQAENERLLAKREREELSQRVRRVVELLGGAAAIGDVSRGGQLLFESKADPKDAHTDHPASKGVPSRQQIRAVFGPTHNWPDQISSKANLPKKCDETWKALFSLARGVNTLAQFRERTLQSGSAAGPSPLPAAVEAGDFEHPYRSHHPVRCPHCFADAMRYLLCAEYISPPGADAPGGAWRREVRLASDPLADRISIQVEGRDFYLPSRPGVRFLIALCDLVLNLQRESRQEGNCSVERVEFRRGCAALHLRTPLSSRARENLTEMMLRRSLQSFLWIIDSTRGSFARVLASCPPFENGVFQDLPDWGQLLTDELHAGSINPRLAERAIEFRWMEE